jgi:hypothetical protein
MQRIPTIYYICNQQGAIVRDVWDALELKLTFRRNFSPSMMDQWLQVEHIAKSIKYDGVEDATVWELHGSGVYTSLFIITIYMPS